MQQPRSWLPSSSCCCSPGWRGRAGGWLHYCRCDHFPGEFLPSSGELLSCWETPTIGERADKYLKAIEGNPCRQSRDRNQKTWSTAFKGSGKMLCKGSKKTTIGIPSKQHKYFQCVFLFIESCTNPFSRLWNITNNFNTLNKQRWNDSIQSVISDYQVFFIIATSLFWQRHLYQILHNVSLKLEFPLLRKAFNFVPCWVTHCHFYCGFLRGGLTLVF